MKALSQDIEFQTELCKYFGLDPNCTYRLVVLMEVGKASRAKAYLWSKNQEGKKFHAPDGKVAKETRTIVMESCPTPT